jgi:hypothetical protein
MTDRDRLIELMKKADKIASNKLIMDYDDAIADNADYLLANGVIVPPCKVGDMVYEIQPIRQRVQSYEITTLKWNGHYWWFTWILKDRKGIYGNVEGFSSHQFGKTVFLTKEEAEAKLKELKGNAT